MSFNYSIREWQGVRGNLGCRGCRVLGLQYGFRNAVWFRLVHSLWVVYTRTLAKLRVWFILVKFVVYTGRLAALNLLYYVEIIYGLG